MVYGKRSRVLRPDAGGLLTEMQHILLAQRLCQCTRYRSNCSAIHSDPQAGPGHPTCSQYTDPVLICQSTDLYTQKGKTKQREREWHDVIARCSLRLGEALQGLTDAFLRAGLDSLQDLSGHRLLSDLFWEMGEYECRYNGLNLDKLILSTLASLRCRYHALELWPVVYEDWAHVSQSHLKLGVSMWLTSFAYNYQGPLHSKYAISALLRAKACCDVVGWLHVTGLRPARLPMVLGDLY